MEAVPSWLTTAASIAFGLVLGSFTNVLIARLPRRESIRYPGSHCLGCQAPIRWYDNIPVVSYLVLRGKCRRCGMKIAFRYPVVELLCALLFLAAKNRYGWDLVLVIRDWPMMVFLLAITFIDLEHRIIPDVLSLGGLALGIATSWLVPELGILRSISGAALGFSFFYVLAWAYRKRSGKMGLGGGDIKLLAMLGAFLGPMGVIVTVMVSSLVGSVVGIAWALATRQQSILGAAIPFGPFLVVGALYYYLLGTLLWLPFTIPT